MSAREHVLKGTLIVTKYLQIARIFFFKAEIKSRVELITKDTTTLINPLPVLYVSSLLKY